MNKFLILLFFLTYNFSFSQSIENVSKGGYIYSSPDIRESNKKTLCPKGENIKVLGIYQNNNDLMEVRFTNEIGSFFGYMLASEIEYKGKVEDVKDSPELEPLAVKTIPPTSNEKTVNIKLNKTSGGTYYIPCTLNGLRMNFVFDTGASDVSISLTEALFMFKNGYLEESDITGTQKYSIANGDIVEGTTIIIRELEFGGLKLRNIKASISNELQAPLLLGQSALYKLGKIQIDYKHDILTIIED